VPREQRLVFGEVAEQYDRVRPGYPDSLVDEVIASASLQPGDAVLEVGCGTGKATVSFAARGLRVLAIEPDENMAAVARRNCADFDVEVVTTSFEDFLVTAGPFALVLSAQAWHWVRPGFRVTRAHDVMRDGGALALCWNRPDWPDTEVSRALDAAYERIAPGLGARTPGRSPQDVGRKGCTDELAVSALFGPLAFTEHPWSTTYDTGTYLELLATQSDHRMLEPATRARLFEAVAAAVDAAGGAITVSYVADLYLAHRIG
jgi:SAM-dependent methyltransferase